MLPHNLIVVVPNLVSARTKGIIWFSTGALSAHSRSYTQMATRRYRPPACATRLPKRRCGGSIAIYSTNSSSPARPSKDGDAAAGCYPSCVSHWSIASPPCVHQTYAIWSACNLSILGCSAKRQRPCRQPISPTAGVSPLIVGAVCCTVIGSGDGGSRRSLWLKSWLIWFFFTVTGPSGLIYQA